MNKLATILFAVLIMNSVRVNAIELLRNGGFEQPITCELAQTFRVDQQNIPGWEFTGNYVQIVNHTRLLAGEGFQCLLLPGGVNDLASIRQKFTLTSAGPVRISVKLAASKALAGEIKINLDGNVVKTIQLKEFWKPEEMALTDQMKWRLVALPEIQLSPGEHILGIRVPKFQPRNDHQGDARDNIEGILVDAASVQYGAPDSIDQKSRAWAVEKKIPYKSKGVLSLDGVAGPWVSTRTLACYPSIANFCGALRSTKELGGLQYLHFVDVGGVADVLDAISLNGEPVFCDQSRWYPYQVCTRAHSGPLDVWSITRMVSADCGVLNLFAVTNQSEQSITRVLSINLQSEQTGIRPGSKTIIIHGSPARVYCFTPAPDRIVNTNGETLAEWNISLAPHAGQEISLTLAMEKTSEAALKKAQSWGEDFAATFAAAKSGWEDRWQAVFTPNNGIYSSCLPTIETDDEAIRELYYLSVASLLETERDNFQQFKQCFVTVDPEWGGDSSWFWDYSLTSLPFALLNPAVMKIELRHWLTIDWRMCSHFSLYDGKPLGNWYAVNPYAYFLSLDRYLTVTGDFEFLTNKVNDKTVLSYMEELALDWKRLVPKNGTLADIGGNCWNVLEAPPNYIHTVASINAENIWMMRRLAEYEVQFGNPEEAARLRADANATVPDLLKLYNPKTGSWNVLYPNGMQIDSRHIYDYLTVGTTISQDLSPNIKTGMINFVDRELMTRTWMRAMSRQDPSAFNSDRSDHGPAGSYTGWPAKAAQATAELGRFDDALEMFHRFRKAFRSAIPQAIELTKIDGRQDLQARVSTRAGASFEEVSGSFAEVIINTFFGFRPTPDGKTALWSDNMSRGFEGRLSNVRWGKGFYTIVCDKNGLHKIKE